MKTIIAKDGIRLLMEQDGSYYAMTSWLVIDWWIIILFALVFIGIGYGLALLSVRKSINSSYGK